MIGLVCLARLDHQELFASDPDNWFNEFGVDHKIEYSNHIIFSLSGSPNKKLSEVRLNYSFNNSKIWSYKYADTSTEYENRFEVLLETGKANYIPPATQITYYFNLISVEGDTYTSKQSKFYYLDPSVAWKSTTSKHLTLMWHDRNVNEINSVAKKVTESNLQLIKLLNLQHPLPITGVILNSRSEAKKGFPKISEAAIKEDLYGGFAFSDYNIFIITGAAPSGIIHESTHLLVNQSLNSSPTRIPAWLNEGLAMYFEERQYMRRTEENILQYNLSGQLFNIGDMSTVPGKPSDVRLFYSIAESFVAFLFSEYGDGKIKDLLNDLDSGKSVDEAILSTYGTSLSTIQSNWLNSISNRFERKFDIDIGSFGTSLLLSIAFLIGLSVSIVGWFKYKLSDHNPEDHLREDEYEDGYWDRK